MSTRTRQTDLWQSEWGNAYVDRNKINDDDTRNRSQFWDRTIKQLYVNSNRIPESFLEIGAGQGANLIALQNNYKDMEKAVDLYATEINEKSRLELSKINNIKILDNIHDTSSIADCVFTMGLLVHLHPAHLVPMMRGIFKASKKWIVCAEYFAPETRAIPYRGEPDALWLDDYGSKWIDNFPLRVLGYGFLWKRMSGLDNLTFWLLEKTQ